MMARYEIHIRMWGVCGDIVDGVVTMCAYFCFVCVVPLARANNSSDKKTLALPACSIATTQNVDLATAVSWCGLFVLDGICLMWPDRQHLIRRNLEMRFRVKGEAGRKLGACADCCDTGCGRL